MAASYSDDAPWSAGCDAGPVGFNPMRPHRRRPGDVVFVAAAVAVCLVALAWAVGAL